MRTDDLRRGARALGLALALPLALSLPAGAAEPFRTGAPTLDAEGDAWRLTLGGEGVADRVPHAPNAEGGGFEPARERPRYVGAELAVDWRPSPAWHVSGSVGQRTMTFLRDSYTVDGLHLGVARRLPLSAPRTTFALALDVDVHRADELYKNSWTEVGDVRLTGASLRSARDDTLMASLLSRTRLGPTTSVAAVLGVGRTRAVHGGLGGTGTDDRDCRYGFETSGGTGALQLLEPCGEVVAFEETYANERGIERRFGFSPSSDLGYRSRVLQLGGALEHRGHRFHASLGYVYRRHDRDGVDERIRARGGRAVGTSHTTSLGVGYAVSRAIGLSAGVHYRSTAYLDELPLLYNAFTSERFVRNVLSFGSAVTFSF